MDRKNNLDLEFNAAAAALAYLSQANSSAHANSIQQDDGAAVHGSSAICSKMGKNISTTARNTIKMNFPMKVSSRTEWKIAIYENALVI